MAKSFSIEIGIDAGLFGETHNRVDGRHVAGTVQVAGVGPRVPLGFQIIPVGVLMDRRERICDNRRGVLLHGDLGEISELGPNSGGTFRQGGIGRRNSVRIDGNTRHCHSGIVARER